MHRFRSQRQIITLNNSGGFVSGCMQTHVSKPIAETSLPAPGLCPGAGAALVIH